MCMGIYVLVIFLPNNGNFGDSTKTSFAELLGLSFIVISVVCVPWCQFEKAPKALLPVTGAVTLPHQRYSIGPPDDGDEETSLVTNERPGSYQATDA